MIFVRNSKLFLKSKFNYYFTYRDRVSTYRAGLAAWEFTNAESGLGYWQALRGIAFENAVALLFRRRGCVATTTKGSGDGGIDLVLTFGGKAYWCQCKAYAKSVSVAPIREIAGVCSRGQAVPVLLAINGYTKPALQTAEELGVRCLDAHDLCKLARMTTIASIS
jgi:HJR/Mrr/RecB family endonuclease